MELDYSVLNQTEIIITMVAGLALLLFGYRIKKVAFFVIWFLLGTILMNYLLPYINDLVPAIAGNEVWQWVLPLAGGLLLALMGFTIEKVCVGGLAFGLSMAIAVQYFGAEPQVLGIAAVVGVVASALAVLLMKPAVIIVTSLAGAYALTVGLFFFVVSLDIDTWYFPALIGITILGSLIQFLTTRKS